MALNSISVILVMILAGLSYAENLQTSGDVSNVTMTTNTTTTMDKMPVSDINNDKLSPTPTNTEATTNDTSVTTTNATTSPKVNDTNDSSVTTTNVTSSPKVNDIEDAKSKKLCVLIDFGAHFNLTYASKGKTRNITVHKDGLKNLTTTCNESNQSVTVHLGKLTNMTFYFEANASTKEYMLSKINLSINDADNETIKAYQPKGDFIIPLGKSYQCNTGKTLELTTITGDKINVTFSTLQFEAFRNGSQIEFSSSKVCKNDDSGSTRVVVISVVSVLAVLVISLLLGYLILRRRTILSACAKH